MTGERDILQRLGSQHGEGTYNVVREKPTLFGDQLRAWSSLVTGPPAIQKRMPWFFDNYPLYSRWTLLDAIIVFHVPLQTLFREIRVEAVVFHLLPCDSGSGCYRYNLDYVGVISHGT